MIGFVFTIDGQHYALPLESVDEALPMAWVTSVAESPAEVSGVLDVRGEVVTVVDPAHRLGAPVRAGTASDFLVLARSHAGRLALRVDSLVGLLDGQLEAAPPSVEGPPWVAGLMRGAGALVTVVALDAFLRPEVRVFAQRLREQPGTSG
jgi:chemotaxis signal transduction protein